MTIKDHGSIQSLSTCIQELDRKKRLINTMVSKNFLYSCAILIVYFDSINVFGANVYDDTTLAFIHSNHGEHPNNLCKKAMNNTSAYWSRSFNTCASYIKCKIPRSTERKVLDVKPKESVECNRRYFLNRPAQYFICIAKKCKVLPRSVPFAKN